ncbi:hypothetical protein H257_11943 [Aphanomyces astaci]|uniref:HSF-type DNA-binding domain-containing protein n=1 Tax=Aphanomyces astaci TaxID=112090 RepID=W4G1H3_APHAT|nr:hypothetical protein H257_11943 [Aphanomyces astaci]ETV73121.1 hypothetical protein H257_11943 [Aphanomyces astaci]KAF0753009.1 hypothetical protein AaE_005842 [Aphanomyces astaci]RHY28033.1 hypothetical protein DYB25_013094 [Aphanomyces astaci]RHY43694.1 hypothetical protein DYB38_011741 [Aphanomyces astaci]RHY74192.1 hypothetical protein DYB34_013658 [Aphanomyces astaci]|eukprot:XP_009837326.1 hypothetical protein H257_11943 [Aphanomyces astaci]
MNHVPVFLQKTYDMIENCADAVATWSTSGESFIIKRINEFASDVLPRYFKHNNFSSFARQLNFYGFHKVKKEDILLRAKGLDSPTDADAALEAQGWWEFSHPLFLRDYPEKMGSIRRKTYADSNQAQAAAAAAAAAASMQSSSQHLSTKSELDELKGFMTELVGDVKSELATLKNQVNLLTHHMTSLGSLMHLIVQTQSMDSAEPSMKRRKLDSAMPLPQQQQLLNGGGLTNPITLPPLTSMAPSTTPATSNYKYMMAERNDLEESEATAAYVLWNHARQEKML